LGAASFKSALSVELVEVDLRLHMGLDRRLGILGVSDAHGQQLHQRRSLLDSDAV
jgi:hypothetical protein